MAISRKKKEALVKGYLEHLEASEAVIITDYRGLLVPETEELRLAIRKAEGSFAVVKNTLAKRALKDAGWPAADDMLVGPVGIGFCHENIPGVAKAITDFAKKNDTLTVSGGLMGDKVLDEATIKTLAKLPTLNVLRSRLLGLINAPATQLTGVVAGGVRQLINVVNAYAEKEDEQVPAEA